MIWRKGWGIYIYLNKERVAAGQTDLDVANFKNAVGKYKNAYEIATVGGKVGDAITETKGWHGSETSEWLWNNGSKSSLLRAYEGSLFSYYGKSGHHATAYDASLNMPWSSRAVIVVGNGY